MTTATIITTSAIAFGVKQLALQKSYYALYKYFTIANFPRLNVFY